MQFKIQQLGKFSLRKWYLYNTLKEMKEEALDTFVGRIMQAPGETYT